MTRLNKSRLWCTQTKEFIDPRKFVVDGYGDIFLVGTSGIIIRADKARFILQLATGLLDKNNNEIYEGDIVKTRRGGHLIVNYLPEYAGFKMTNLDKKKYLSLIIDNDIEVIGNIYQNPEHKHLLEARE